MQTASDLLEDSTFSLCQEWGKIIQGALTHVSPMNNYGIRTVLGIEAQIFNLDAA